VNFSLFGSPRGSATTAANGVATLNGVSLSGFTAGTYPNAVAVSFTATASLQASSGAADVTVERAPVSIAVTGGGTFAYDGSAHAASGSVTGVSGASLGAASITYTNLSDASTTAIAPSNAGAYSVTASFAGNTSYLAGSNSSITIAIAAASTSTSLQTWSVSAPAGTGPAFSLYGAAEFYDAAGRLIVVTSDSSNPFILNGANGLAGTPAWTSEGHRAILLRRTRRPRTIRTPTP
jgi:hypothetical protein